MLFVEPWNNLRDLKNLLECVYTSVLYLAGLSIRAGGRGFSPATKRVAPGYFYWKIDEK